MLNHRIGFVGAGQMARALASGFLRAGLIQAQQIAAHDPLPAAADRFAAEISGAGRMADNLAVVEAADLVVLAVKPQVVESILKQLRGRLSDEKLVVSIAAGVSLAELEEGLGTGRVIRVMPNTPCMVGAGACAYALGSAARAEDGELVGELFRAVGVALRLPESLLDAVTGLSGSGPAFVYLMIEALSDGGVRMGLPRSAALELAAQTVRGAAEMVQRTGEHPAVLKDRVASPGGTTLAGLEQLERRAVRGALMDAVAAAARRSRELGRK